MTAAPTKPRRKQNQRPCDIEIVFANKPTVESWTQFRISVFSANLREHVPAHLQSSLLDEFVKAGLMTP